MSVSFCSFCSLLMQLLIVLQAKARGDLLDLSKGSIGIIKGAAAHSREAAPIVESGFRVTVMKSNQYGVFVRYEPQQRWFKSLGASFAKNATILTNCCTCE
jgi:hypothetical protein